MTSTRFARPRIVAFTALHAPIALPFGRTPIRISVEGSGRLVVGDASSATSVVRWVDGALDEVIFVASSTLVRARFVGPRGADDGVLYLVQPFPAPTNPPLRAPLVVTGTAQARVGASSSIRMPPLVLPRVVPRTVFRARFDGEPR